jgi:sigma-B regulation protein RsbU (phosphoserine phosphatase)
LVAVNAVNPAAPVLDESPLDLQALVGHSEIVQASDTLETVHTRFEQHGKSFMAVFEEGQIIGLCSRRRVGMALGSRNGLEKFSHRPICDFLLPGMTVVRVGQALPDVLSVVFSRPEETLLDEVVLMDDYGQFLGLKYARSLVRMQYLLLRQNIEQIEKSRCELNAKNVEMENDLQMASEIQQALLPPSVDNALASHFRIAHHYQPMGVVSGDFFHRLELAPGKVGLFVCDVMGHGVRSAFITAMLRALIQELHHLGDRPGELLAHMNEELKAILQQTDSPLYATAIYMVIEAVTGRVGFASAGHPDSLLLQAGSGLVKNVSPAPKTKGPALGMRAGAIYGQTEFQMQPGETLLIFTDGLCEIFNAQEQEFGREQLAQAAQLHAMKPLRDMLTSMVAEALAFAGGTFQDDVCLVGLELVPPPNRNAANLR